jgi:hypothetical protein
MSTADALEQGVEQIVVRVLERMGYFDDAEANEYRRKLALLYAKDFWKPAEAAFVLGCSDTHLRNLVKKAQAGQATRPIPFLDLDGATVFRREALLEWANLPKPRIAAVNVARRGGGAVDSARS